MHLSDHLADHLGGCILIIFIAGLIAELFILLVVALLLLATLRADAVTCGSLRLLLVRHHSYRFIGKDKFIMQFSDLGTQAFTGLAVHQSGGLRLLTLLTVVG